MSRLANHVVALLLCGVIVIGQVPAWLHVVTCESTSQCEDQNSGDCDSNVIGDCQCGEASEPENECPFKLRRESLEAQSDQRLCDSGIHTDKHDHQDHSCPCDHDHDSDTCAVCQTLASAPGLIQLFQTCCYEATLEQPVTVFDSVIVDDEQFCRMRTRGPPTA